MPEHMTAAQYRALVVDPALANQPLDDVTFKKKFNSVKVPQPKEHEIQNAILDRLKYLKGSFFWRENSGMISAEYKGVKRVWRAGLPGIPDIMGIYKGLSIGIEVKRPGMKQRPDQVAFMARFLACGGIYILCTDAEKVIEQLENELKAVK